MSIGHYDGVEKLDAWGQRGEFPVIHDAIFKLLVDSVDPSVGLVLDMGASTGLLAHRMYAAGFAVTAIEADSTSIDQGISYGLYQYGDRTGITVKKWKVLGQDADELTYWLGAKRVKVIMARRVLPELDNAGLTPALFADAARKAGVEHLFLEGRAPRMHTTHRLDCLARELAEIGGWVPERFDGPHRVHLVQG